MTIDTWESNDVVLPDLRLFSSFPGQTCLGLSDSFGSPGLRLVRTSSDTGNKAEIIQKKVA